ncbi:IS701 family transposase [Streptomyces sp. NPDC090499]|uniref:IS701 family transposase n=1 Tax=Streptomyces sp. NPDC090499 TaxID=3365965 RepID=UPI00382DF80A
MSRIASRFARVEPRRRIGLLVTGLLSDLPRKNCWTLAEHAGDATPHCTQHLLHRAKWDADRVRDDIPAYVVQHLHDDAVLVVDETGGLGKGTSTVGVQRQYTGTAGRVENAQVGVCLVYSAARGHAAIDRALYIPRSWTDDPDRCRSAGIPDGLAFATKPQSAAQMVERALDAGTPARRVTGDEVHGDTPHLRAALEQRRTGHVLAVSSTHVVTQAGRFQARALAARVPKRAWQRLSAGAGAKGERYYDWAQVDIQGTSGQPDLWSLMVRRNRRTGELAFHRCFSPHPVPMSELVRVAGRRWTVEETFQASTGLTCLDEHQFRRWTSWHRWVTLAMLAHAFPAVTAATERHDRPARDDLIPLTGNEIHHLFAALIGPVHGLAHRLRWSHWRRRHQARTRQCHYWRQAALQP